MGNCNEIALESILSRYEDEMEQIREFEIYKWEALRDFKSSWDLDSTDLAGMLEKSLFGFAQYLSSPVSYPLALLVELARCYPNQVRSELKPLLDRSSQLNDRLSTFCIAMKRIKENMYAIIEDTEFILRAHAQDTAAPNIPETGKNFLSMFRLLLGNRLKPPTGMIVAPLRYLASQALLN